MITTFFKPKAPKSSENSSETNGKRARDAGSQAASVRHGTTSNKKLREGPALSPEVEELLSHLNDDNDGSIGNSWRRALDKHISSPSFARLAKYVASERRTQTIYPPACDTFSALNLTPLHKVKVVVVGQDPYHQPMQAHGLSFSVRKGVKVPMSLRNIHKELADDPKVDFSVPNHGFLGRWTKQGVLMINAVLTVRKGTPNSHRNRGWEKFTDEVIRALVQESHASGNGLVFLLWGKPASAKAHAILKNGRTKHKIICTSHPSPLGATKTNFPFLGSRCFSRVNEALKELGLEPIDWNVDDV